MKLTAVKIDEETGKTAQGDATLEGAVYGVYSDAACTKLIKSYKTDKNYQFETDYMRCGKTYYLKEVTPPRGYLKNDKVLTLLPMVPNSLQNTIRLKSRFQKSQSRVMWQ